MIELCYADFYKRVSTLKVGGFHAIVLDLPYDLFGNEKDLPELQWDQVHDLPYLGRLLQNLLKPNGYLIAFGNIQLAMAMLQEWKHLFRLRDHYIWEKPGAMPSNRFKALRVHEFVLVFMRKDARDSLGTWHPQVMEGKPYRKRNTSPDVPTRKQKKAEVSINATGRRHIRSVIHAPHKPVMRKWERLGISHRTIKSIYLVETLLKAYTNPGARVLDPFAGSASTAVACYLQDRDCTAFENDSVYFMEAVQRIERIKIILGNRVDQGYPTSPLSSLELSD